MAARALALHAAGRGDAARAARWLARAQQVAARRQSAHEAACNGLCAAQLAMQQGSEADARQQAAAAAAAFERLQMDWHAAQARGVAAGG